MLREILRYIITGEIILTCFGLIVFVFSYMTFFNWNKTQAGRSLMYFVVSLLALVLVSVTRIVAGADSAFFEILRGIVYTGLFFTTWHLVKVLWRSHSDNSNTHPVFLSPPKGKPYIKSKRKVS